MKYKALISGGCGFVGSHLVEALVKLGWEITVVDNLFTHKNNITELIKYGKAKFLIKLKPNKREVPMAISE